MKTKTYLFAFILVVGLSSSWAQDTWIQEADFGGTPRYGAVGFSIGTKGYLGIGNDGGSTFKKDFWEYDSATNAWTQKADFGGGPREHAAGFTIGSKGYVGTGSDGPNVKKDLWEYDPATNIWTQKADFGGVSRYLAAGFSVGANGYIGTGTTHGCCPLDTLKDVWEYDAAADTWTRKADFGGGHRAFATGFSIGSKGYIGSGQDNDSNFYIDFWEFDPIANTWTRKADFGGGTGRKVATGFSIGSVAYMGLGEDPSGTTKDFWEYDPATNGWTRKADFRGNARAYANGFTIGEKGYIGTGVSGAALYNDFWGYTPGNSSSGLCIAPPGGLVSWWSGDRTADDVQGTNNGVLKNGASFRPGKVGPGFVFDGIDDVVTIPNSSSLSQAHITLGAWVYVTGKQGVARFIVAKDNAGASREYILGIGDENSFVADVWLASGLVDLRNTTTVQLNTWYHVAMTHDGLKLRLYVNGILDGSADAVGSIVPTVNPVGIGGNTFVPVFFQGIIDEAQIFDRALSDAEVLAIYQAGADGQCKPDIFVASIDPSYTVSGHGFRISTSIVIQDVNGIGISDTTVQLGVILPGGSALTFPLKTDATGQANVSFTVADSGLYQFKVRNVNHPIREYDASLNIETSDTLVIP